MRKENWWFRVTVDGALDHPKVKELKESDQLCWIKLLAIASEHNKNGELPEPWWIALRLGKQQPATCKMLARLIEAGLIDRDADDPGLLRMHDWPEWQGGVWRKSRQSDDKVATKSRQSDNSTPQNPSVYEGEDAPSIREEKRKIRIPSLSPTADTQRRPGGRERPKPSMTAFHDEFWPLYPKKVSKQAAEKAWGVLDPSPEQVAEIMKALQAQIDAGTWQEARFIPHPATWINGKRWSDESPSRAPRRVEVAL